MIRHAFIDILIAFFLWRVARTLLEIGIHYDVICIYIRHLLERMQDKFPHVVPIVEKMFCYLPAFHAHGHQERCQITYSLRLTQGCGDQHGEGVEPPWSFSNPAGLSTREMMAGHHQDRINALWNFFNQRKREKEGAS